MTGKGVGQAHLCSNNRAVCTGAKDINRYVYTFRNGSTNRRIAVVGRKVSKDVGDFLMEAEHRYHPVGTNGARCFMLSDGCPSQPECNTYLNYGSTISDVFNDNQE